MLRFYVLIGSGKWMVSRSFINWENAKELYRSITPTKESGITEVGLYQYTGTELFNDQVWDHADLIDEKKL